MNKKKNIETNMINIIDKFIESYDNIKGNDDSPLSLYNEIEIHSPSMTKFDTCCIKVINEASVVVFLHQNNEWRRFEFIHPMPLMGELRYGYKFDLKSYIETSSYEPEVYTIHIDRVLINSMRYDCEIYPYQIKLFSHHTPTNECVIIKSPRLNSWINDIDILGESNTDIDVIKTILSKSHISLILEKLEENRDMLYRSIDNSFEIIAIVADDFYNISIDNSKRKVTVENMSAIDENATSIVKKLTEIIG